MKAQFKEKTFETYFGFELARLTKRTYAPDQCDENRLGFDGAFYLPHRFPLPIIPHRRLRHLRSKDGISLKQIDDIADHYLRHLPAYKLNLFVQYKRPDFITTNRGTEWNSWNKAYYRFDIDTNQQKRLAALKNFAKRRADVVYESPAFFLSTDLYTYAESGNIVAKSNITDVMKLVGHHCFTYQNPGSSGKAHSEPVEVESRSLDQIIADAQDLEELPLNQIIKDISKNIAGVMKKEEEQYLLLNRIRRLILGDFADEADERSNQSFYYALATVAAFSEITNVAYYALGSRA